jgi:hypothetical protein
MKDYEYGEFSSFDEFKSRIEFERDKAKAYKDNL